MIYEIAKIEKSKLEESLKHFLDNNYEKIYYDNGESSKLKAIIPIIEDGATEKLLVVSEFDKKDNCMTLIINDDEIEIELTEAGYHRILICDKIIYEGKEYQIQDRIFNVSDENIILKLK